MDDQPQSTPIHCMPAAGAPWRTVLEYGKLLRQHGDVDGAEHAFHRAWMLDPSRPEPLLERARLHLDRGNVEQAEELLWELLQHLPACVPAAVLLCRLLLARDARTWAAAVLAGALGHRPRDPLLLLAQGELHLNERRPDEAQRCFLRAQAGGAQRAAVRAGLARAEHIHGIRLLEKGRRHEAAFRFKRAADLDQAWAEPRVQLALLLLQLGNPRRALALGSEAVRLSPASAEPHYHLGCILRQLGSLNAAAGAFDQALRLCPMGLQAWQARRALADLLAIREPARALLLYAEEVARCPADADLWSLLGQVCQRLGDRRQAARCFRESLRNKQPQPLSNHL